MDDLNEKSVAKGPGNRYITCERFERILFSLVIQDSPGQEPSRYAMSVGGRGVLDRLMTKNFFSWRFVR
jgi:hypothetical protein